MRELLRKNAKVYLACRSEERAHKAMDELRENQLPGKVEFLRLDLASLHSIKEFSEQFLAKEQRLDMLFNSAGVMNPYVGPQTKDGYELHLGTNSLGHHYLTQLLVPALQASATASPDRPPRVCFTSSIAHRGTSPKGFDPTDPTGLHTHCYMPSHNRAYGTSKFCNILSANWFQRNFGAQNIVFTSCHPGILKTGLVREWNQGLNTIMMPIIEAVIFYPQRMGCITQLYLNTAPEAATKGGSYFAPWARQVDPLPLARDVGVQDTFAKWVDEQVTKHMGQPVDL